MTRMLPPKCSFTRNEDGSFTAGDDREVAKVTGTSFGAVLGLSEWQTPFTAALGLLGIYREDLSGKPAIEAGRLLESRILAFAGAIPAADLFPPRVGDHDEWPSDFDDPDFAGHIDGMTADGRIVEVKTTERIEDWQTGAPQGYLHQASLYSHFLAPDAKTVVFLVGILTDEDRRHPEKWTPEGHVMRFEVPLAADLDAKLAQARAFRQALVATGRSPVPTGAKADRGAVEALAPYVATEEEGKAMLAEAMALKEQLDAAALAVKAQQDRFDELKDELRAFLKGHGLPSLDGGTGRVAMTVVPRTTYDLTQMRLDGIDLDRYARTVEDGRLTFKTI